MVQRSLALFESAIKTEATYKNYMWFLGQFAKHFRIVNYDLLCSFDNRKLARMLEDFILFHKKKGKSSSWMRLSISSLELFFSQNDIVLNWKKLKRMIPARDNCKSGKMPYDKDDVKKLLQNTAILRTKALVHFMASTGARIGSVPALKLRDLVVMDRNCVAVRLYSDSADQYWSFLTKEAADAYFAYLQQRRSQQQERLASDSPAFAQQGTTKPITKQAITCLIRNLLKKAGIKRVKTNSFRYDKMLTHGFRKRTATIIKMRNDISYSVSEILLGHRPYLDKSYFTPTPAQLFDEFQKVEPELVISGQNSQQLVPILQTNKQRQPENETTDNPLVQEYWRV